MTQVFNTRILLSLGVIVAVSAALISATGAFFSDTETSSNNTFSAGTLEIDVNGNGTGSAVASINTSNVMPGDLTTNNVTLKVIGGDAWIKTVLTPSATSSADLALAGFIHNSFYYSTDGGTNWTKIVTNTTGPVQGQMYWNTLTGELTYYHGVQLTPADTLLVRGNTCVGQLGSYTDNNPTDDTCNGSAVTNNAQGGSITTTLVYMAQQYKNNTTWAAF